MVHADLFTESFLVPSVLFIASVTVFRTFVVKERSLRLVGLGFFLGMAQSGVFFANSCQRKEGLLAEAFFGNRLRGKLLPPNLQFGSPILSFAGIVSAWHQKNCKASPLRRVNGLDLTIFYPPQQALRAVLELQLVLSVQHPTSPGGSGRHLYQSSRAIEDISSQD